jgi:hypothetical protein
VLDRVGQNEQVLFIGRIVFVIEKVLQPPGSQDAHERVFRADIRLRQRRLEKLDVGLDFLLPDIGHGAAAYDAFRRRRQELKVLVEFRELDALIRLERHERRFTGFQRPRRETAQPPAVIRQAAETELADFPVTDHVDAGTRLPADDVDDTALNGRS